MAFKDFISEVNEETKLILSNDFKLNIVDANVLPGVDDQGITYENFDNKTKGVKTISTCVLHIDLRQSTKLNLEESPAVLAKLYSCFIRGVIKCAEYYGGKVRNIAGDRVMVLFECSKCFENAVSAAILLHTFSSYILNKHFKNSSIACGIGIDYGKMLATKVGTIKQGTENPTSKSIVWLGYPANIASKLADIANKDFSRPIINIGKKYPWKAEWDWSEKEIDEFFDGLEMKYSYSIVAQFKEPYILSFFKGMKQTSYSAILMTKRVFDGFKKESPADDSIVKGFWKPRMISISGYNGLIYCGSVYFTFAEQLK